MAEKEATVYIVDLGLSMGEKHNDRDESDLDWAMRYVWDKITTTVATGRKTANVGVVGLRTDDTSNELGEEQNYEHIAVLQPISQILMDGLRSLRSKIRPSSTDTGDAISALVIAIQMISKHCKKLKYWRKIVLVTNGMGSMDASDMDEITAKLKEDEIQLIVLGVDFDDPEFGTKEEDKDSLKAQNEETLKALTEKCDGVFGTLEQAITELGVPRIKAVKPMASFKGQLTLGGDEYETTMSIDVERYPRVMVAKAPSASSFVVRNSMANGESSAHSSATIVGDGAEHGGSNTANGLTSVKSARTYQVTDEQAPGGKRDVERDDLAKGYEYGRTAVPISESEENVTKLETEPQLTIIGFVPWAKYDRYMNMSTSNIIVAQRVNEKAIMAMSSLVHALFELESYAVARLVTKENRPPLLILLAPSIEPDYECLTEVQLPFAEDVRPYKFPPLDRAVTVSGKVLREHRNLPSKQLSKAMSDYVDQMDLSTYGKEEEGIPDEYMAMEDTYSPVLHRIDQVVRWRAVHPTEPVPPPYEILTRYSKPPADLQEKAQSALKGLVTAADVKKVPPKLKGRKRQREQVKPLSGLNVDELLGREKRSRISADNAVPEFKQMLATTEDVGAIQDLSRQMSEIIISQIKHSLGDSGYGRAVEALGVMREELTALEEPRVYNDFMRDLKAKIFAGELNGERKDMWYEIRRNRLGLIDCKISSLSDVNEETARLFLTHK